MSADELSLRSMIENQPIRDLIQQRRFDKILLAFPNFKSTSKDLLEFLVSSIPKIGKTKGSFRTFIDFFQLLSLLLIHTNTFHIQINPQPCEYFPLDEIFKHLTEIFSSSIAKSFNFHTIFIDYFLNSRSFLQIPKPNLTPEKFCENLSSHVTCIESYAKSTEFCFRSHKFLNNDVKKNIDLISAKLNDVQSLFHQFMNLNKDYWRENSNLVNKWNLITDPEMNYIFDLVDDHFSYFDLTNFLSDISNFIRDEQRTNLYVIAAAVEVALIAKKLDQIIVFKSYLNPVENWTRMRDQTWTKEQKDFYYYPVLDSSSKSLFDLYKLAIHSIQRVDYQLLSFIMSQKMRCGALAAVGQPITIPREFIDALQLYLYFQSKIKDFLEEIYFADVGSGYDLYLDFDDSKNPWQSNWFSLHQLQLAFDSFRRDLQI